MMTIATFSKVEDAHLLRMRLEAAGIPAFIPNENTIQVDWGMTNMLGGVTVEVDEEDFPAARALLSGQSILWTRLPPSLKQTPAPFFPRD